MSLIAAPRIEQKAIDYASHVLLAYEWEGFSDPPLGEAAHTEDAATKYVALWMRVSKSKDPVIQAFADEIDASEFLYIADQGHPRR